MPITVAKTVIQGIAMSHIALGLAVFVLLVAIPALLAPKKFKEALENFLNAGDFALRLYALFLLFIAFFILNTHWTIKLSSTRSIMTVLGYLLALKGIILFWFPAFVRLTAKKILQKEYMVLIYGVVLLLIGIGLLYLGIWEY